MNKHVKGLALLLAAQLVVLAVVLVWQERASSAPSGALLKVDRNKVDGIVVVDDKGVKLNLQKTDTGWVLPDAKSLPADADKVGSLLDKLVAASAPWPVATSAESAKRFEVTKDKFQREIQLRSGGEVVADLYLGTSPGFKKVHARRADSDDVYAIAFANYEATARADDWLDKNILKPDGDVTVLARPEHWKLERNGETWSLDGLAQGETTKQDAATDLVNKVVNLRVMGVADAAPTDDATLKLTLSATTPKGTFDYRLYQPQPNADFIVTRSGQDGAFKLAAYVGEPLIKDRGDLVGSPTPAEPAKPAPALKPAARPDANIPPSTPS
jgi:Domain of unknown function (DUF4340)